VPLFCPERESLISGLSSDTVHEPGSISFVDQVMVDRSPLRTSEGCAVMFPCPGGAGRHPPPEQPNGHDSFTRDSVHCASRRQISAPTPSPLMSGPAQKFMGVHC